MVSRVDHFVLASFAEAGIPTYIPFQVKNTKHIRKQGELKMKKSLFTLITLTLISFNSFAGVHLTCNQYIVDQQGSMDYMNGVKAISILDCQDKDREQYTMFIKGFGLGGKLAAASNFAVTCPTVNKRRLKRKGKVTLGSAKINASILIGANTAVAVNHRGGFCALVGVDFVGFALNASVGKMVIYKGTTYDNYEALKKYLPEHIND